MIISRLSGGLGNQLFQYAMGISSSRRLQTSFRYYFESKSTDTQRKAEIQYFDISSSALSSTEKKAILFQKNIQQLANQYFGHQLPLIVKVVDEQTYNSIHSLSRPSDLLLVGYWQSEKYFMSYEKLIRSEFVFKRPLTQTNLKHQRKILNSNSISIHFRRGDYTTQSASQFHGNLQSNYYHQSIKRFNTMVKNPTYFIFSDDIEWVKCNITLPSNSYFIEGNSNDKNYIDLQLMSYCKHNIIANSTFSWWASWLNSNPNKIVIGPKDWFVDLSMPNIMPLSWIKI